MTKDVLTTDSPGSWKTKPGRNEPSSLADNKPSRPGLSRSNIRVHPRSSAVPFRAADYAHAVHREVFGAMPT